MILYADHMTDATRPALIIMRDKTAKRKQHKTMSTGQTHLKRAY